jgi:ACS family sodium-dependent inorganic phosphate cotransporter
MVALKIKMFLDTAAVVIEHLGWESVFYLTGGFSLAWVVAWAFLVYDTPAQHPR